MNLDIYPPRPAPRARRALERLLGQPLSAIGDEAWRDLLAQRAKQKFVAPGVVAIRRGKGLIEIRVKHRT